MNNREINHLELIYGDRYGDYMQIGQGSFGNVFKAKNKYGTEIVAIKVIDKQKQKPYLEYMRREIDVLYKNKGNPNIINIYSHHEDENYIYIVLEVTSFVQMPFNVHHKYYGGIMPEEQMITIIRQIVNGISGLHRLNIIHRDLKLENIMVSLSDEDWAELKNGNKKIISKAIFKIIDFGLAKSYKNICRLQFHYGYQFIGNLIIAPEILEHKHYGLKADIYSLGVIFYQLVTGDFPYKATGLGQTQQQVIREQNADFSAFIDPHLSTLIQQMLKCNPEERISFIQIYNHKYFTTDGKMQISKLDLNIQNSKIFYQQTEHKIDQFNYQQIQDDLQQDYLNQKKKEIKIKSRVSLPEGEIKDVDIINDINQISKAQIQFPTMLSQQQSTFDQEEQKESMSTESSQMNFQNKTIIQEQIGMNLQQIPQIIGQSTLEQQEKELENLIFLKNKCSIVDTMINQTTELYDNLKYHNKYCFNENSYSCFLSYMDIVLNKMYQQANKMALSSITKYPQNPLFQELLKLLQQDQGNDRIIQESSYDVIQMENEKIRIKQFYKENLIYTLSDIFCKEQIIKDAEFKELKLNLYRSMLYTINSYVIFNENYKPEMIYDSMNENLNKEIVLNNPDLLLEDIEKQLREHGINLE